MASNMKLSTVSSVALFNLLLVFFNTVPIAAATPDLKQKCLDVLLTIPYAARGFDTPIYLTV